MRRQPSHIDHHLTLASIRVFASASTALQTCFIIEQAVWSSTAQLLAVMVVALVITRQFAPTAITELLKPTLGRSSGTSFVPS